MAYLRLFGDIGEQIKDSLARKHSGVEYYFQSFLKCTRIYYLEFNSSDDNTNTYVHNLLSYCLYSTAGEFSCVKELRLSKKKLI